MTAETVAAVIPPATDPLPPGTLALFAPTGSCRLICAAAGPVVVLSLIEFDPDDGVTLYRVQGVGAANRDRGADAFGDELITHPAELG
jgi:hypothetical protein